MKRIIYVAAAACCALFAQTLSAQTLRVIPQPAQVAIEASTLPVESLRQIGYTESELLSEANYLQKQLAATGYKVRVVKSDKAKKAILLTLDNKLPQEGYRMEVTADQVVIAGGDAAGVFYGAQTLLQELENGGLHLGVVEDAPRYGWRGIMLDEARHFSGEQRVKLLLDMLAHFKMNRFHWHLTDAQGWRIEIKKYPKLAEIGAQGTHSDPDAPAACYTQEQIRDIVAYAKERHIEIIPEVDMPGHATAANHAYPEYSGGGTETHPEFTFNVGKEETYEYLTNILREVAELFPSKWMHIGGDEVAYGIEAWESDKHVQALMRREGFTKVKQAERYFMHRMSDSVKMLGKTLVGWDELLDLNVDPTQNVIMWWRHDKPHYLKRSVGNHYTTILCPRKPLYYDFIQHESHTCGRIWDGFCPIEDVYAFPDSHFKSIEVTKGEQQHIIGMQANLWSELMHNPDRVDFMLFPRLCALSESAWSQPEVKNFENFSTRLEDAYNLFDRLGIYYFDTRDPQHHAEPAGPIIKKKEQPKMDFRD